MVKLVVEHQGADPQAGRRLGGHHQRDERIHATDVVVRVQLLVAERLDPTGHGHQPVAIVERACLHGESEGFHDPPSGRRMPRTVTVEPQSPVAARAHGDSLGPRLSGVVQW